LKIENYDFEMFYAYNTAIENTHHFFRIVVYRYLYRLFCNAGTDGQEHAVIGLSEASTLDAKLWSLYVASKLVCPYLKILAKPLNVIGRLFSLTVIGVSELVTSVPSYAETTRTV
jgi:hypothetical protein